MDRNSWIAVGVVCLASAALAGCSSAGGDNPGPGAGGTSGSGGFNFGGSAATGTGGSSGSATGGADAGGSGGSSGGPPAYVSNTPGAKVTETPAADVVGLTVVSSRLASKPSGSQYYQSWTGLLYNGTPKVVCYGKVSAKFLTASGTEVGSHLAFSDTPPHSLPGSGKLTASCLQPGTVGGLYSNGFFNSPLTLTSIANITFDIEGLVYDSVPLHPSAPAFTGVTLSEIYGPGTGFWAATGTLTATNTIYNIGIDVYPVGADGLVPDRLGDAHLDTLAATMSYAFETTSYEGAPASAQMLAFADFLDGPKSFNAAPTEGSPGVDSLAKLQALAATATTPKQLDSVQSRLKRRRAAMRQRFDASR